MISRTAVLGVARSATATSAFLHMLLAEMPVAVRAMQIDGGSEFMGAFEHACAQAVITLYVLPPRSPKLNGIVERLNGTCRREFWDYYQGTWDLPTLTHALTTWTFTYNRERPHMNLGFLSPAQWHPAAYVSDYHRA